MAVQLEAIASVVQIRASGIKDFFQAFSHRSFPASHLDEVVAYPIRLADYVSQQLPALTKPAPNPVVERTQARQLKRLGLLLEHVHLVAEFLESSDVPAIPGEVSLYLEEVISNLLPDARSVLRADNEF